MKKILTGLCLASLPLASLAASTAEQLVDQYSKKIQNNTQPVGMTMIVIDGNKSYQRYLGETRYGNKTPPQADTLIRIASLTKLMTGEVLVALAADGKLTPDDPLQKFAPAGVVVPKTATDQTISLLNLATHTSGLPRELGQKPEGTPVFVWPTEAQRWQWLQKTRLHTVPGTQAAYSNLAYDLLADALARAGGKPYPVLLRQKVTAPLGMHNTTLTPNNQQCARLMAGVNASPCTTTVAADGSGGVYSTPADMQKWLQALLKPAVYPVIQKAQKMVYQRSDLRAIKGLDHAGEADALGLGWVAMAAKNGAPAMLQKTGGGGGFLTYMVINPKHQVGVFVAMTRNQQTRGRPMIEQANKLLTALTKLH